MDPNTTINMIGKRRENTTEIGLCSMALKLAFARADKARNRLGKVA